MVDYYSDFVGTPDKDAVQLILIKPQGRESISIWGSYECKMNVLTQPSAFSFTLGWGDQLLPLLNMLNAAPKNAEPYPEFELRVAGTPFMTGQIEDVNVPQAKATQLHIEGRDWMMPLFKCSIRNEITFNKQTYAEVVGDIINKCVPGGQAAHTLLFTNESNRDLITKVKFSKRGRPIKADMTKNQLVAEIDTGIQAPGGGHIELQHLLAKVGETWYQWIENELRLAGLLLWATGEGDFILGSPTTNQPARYHIINQRGQTRNEVNIIDVKMTQSYKNMHTVVDVCGRYGAAGGGRAKCTASFVNYVASAKLGGDNVYPLVIEDDDVKNNDQAMYRAKRAVSEELRAAFSLQYTLSGHRAPCILDGIADQMVVWMPDTIVRVDDDERGLHENFYLEGVTLRSSPETTTVIDLVRPRYLNYFAESSAA